MAVAYFVFFVVVVVFVSFCLRINVGNFCVNLSETVLHPNRFEKMSFDTKPSLDYSRLLFWSELESELGKNL